MTENKPSNKPANSNFSSGPCAKRPGWNINLLKNSDRKLLMDAMMVTIAGISAAMKNTW